MDKDINNGFENLSSSEWTFILMYMFLDDVKKRNTKWKNFEEELIYKNRFSVKHEIIEEIHKCKLEATKIIEKCTVLYRARVFEKSNFDKLVKYYLQENGCSQSEIDEILNEWTDEEKMISLIPEIYSDYDSNQVPQLVNAKNKWKRNVRFKGWNSKESGAPPADLIGNGRANPDHIRYLYLSEDSVTPVYEVRPIIGDTVSVAKFKLNRDVKLYDLTLEMNNKESEGNLALPRLYNTIGEMFSRPYNGDVSKYLPTQYISEEIKNLGFDGLRFRSSLHKDGINVVLFNPDDCKALSSDLIDVKGIDLNLDQPMIYKIGTSELNNSIKKRNNMEKL